MVLPVVIASEAKQSRGNKVRADSFVAALLARTAVGSGADAGADRAGHAGAAEPAIARRILREILLVIVLGEKKLAGRRDLGGDRTEALRGQRLLIGGLRGVRGFALLLVDGVDR